MYETRSFTLRTETRNELQIIPEESSELELEVRNSRSNLLVLYLEASGLGAHKASEELLWRHCYGVLLELPFQPFAVLCPFFAREQCGQLIKANICLEHPLYSFIETDMLAYLQPKSPSSLKGKLSTRILFFNPNNLNNGLSYSLPWCQRQTECKKSICD